MAAINPYLNFQGNTEEAFNFYKSVFGGEFSAIMRFKDMEGCDGPDAKISEADGDKIMHISLPIGNGNILMATDALESMGQTLTPGNNYYIHISVDSKEEADKFYNALSEGGKVEMAIADTFWGSYFGIAADKFGVKWMIDYTAQPAAS